ncbi:MAG: hypothetical protein U0939_17125 [Pirellulales bacterium]
MHTRTAEEVLNREFLEMRCKVLELAAAMDRLDRASGEVADDPRLAKIREALSIVADARGDRAEQIQLIFSRPYHEQWRQEFQLDRRS